MDIETFDALTRNDFSVFFQRAWTELEPQDYDHNWHIDCLSEYLQESYNGKYKRLIINVPPRTGKTLLVNICFTAWLLGREPGLRVIGVSYSQRLSEKIAYKTRLLMESEFYKSIFPNTNLDQSQSQKSNFMTTSGGGRFSTSVGGSLTGEGGDYIILDDPMNPAEALSDTVRVNSNEWVDQAIYSRLNVPSEGRIIVIMQRLHSDDTTGHLLSTGEWELVKMPAFSKKEISYSPNSTYNYEGFLHENRLNKETLSSLESSMSGYAYAGQYSQDPVPAGGGDFTKNMINYFSSSRFDASDCNIYITIDPARSKNQGSDYTAMCVLALAPDQNFYLIDGVRKRMKGLEKIHTLFELHRKWHAKTKKPPKVGIEQVGLAEDIHYMKAHMEEVSYRFPLNEIKPPPRTSKEDRIRRLIPFMEQGRIYFAEDIYYKNEKGLSENLINAIVEKELLLFPRSQHDDFIDALSMIFDMSYIFPQLKSFSFNSSIEMPIDQVDVFDL